MIVSRSPFQILVIPFRRTPSGPQYGILRRADQDAWQGVAGGGEDGESPEQAAARESAEELGLHQPLPLYPLQTRSSIPARLFPDRSLWPAGTYVIPEYAFAADLTDIPTRLSLEHTELRWMDFQPASGLLRWDSNRTALGELHERLAADDLPEPLR